MNELIKSIFNNFTVDGVKIPVKFLKYEGHDEPYVTYMQQDADNSYSGDDELLGYVDYYDFDVYSKGNYTNIIEELKRILKENEFVWQPSRSSQDFYENDTGYYHKTLNFAIFKQEDI
jgi:predicted MPP superfamily phosphohydrolase